MSESSGNRSNGMIRWVGVAALIGVCAIASLIAPRVRLDDRWCPPSASPSHLLGCDDLGRPLVPLLIGASARSLAGVFLAVALSTFLTFLLLLATIGRSVDAIDAIVQSWLSVHPFVFAIFCLAVFGSGPGIVVFVVGVVRMPVTYRAISGLLRPVCKEVFVDSVRSAGGGQRRLLYNAIVAVHPTLWTYLGVDLAETMVLLGSLSFLGLAASLEAPDLGILVARAIATSRISKIPLIAGVSSFLLLALAIRLAFFRTANVLISRVRSEP